MSVECDMYVGFTVELYNRLDYEFIDKFNDVDRNIQIIDDGMNGDYTRLIYIDKHIKDVESFEQDYIKLKQPDFAVCDDIISKLKERYKEISPKPLEDDEIEYALWFHWY